jgi:hypothetical protein
MMPATAFTMRPFLLIVASVLLAGCSLVHSSPPASEPTEQIWVGRDFVGGKQCDPHERYSPPDVKALLEQAGIPVAEIRIEHQHVCMACGCPSYAATHFARISRTSMEAAQRLGFTPKQPLND